MTLALVAVFSPSNIFFVLFSFDRGNFNNEGPEIPPTANPTNLTPVDLWNNPIKVAEFLKLPTSLEF
jgi:hypothetical protein